MQENNSGVNTVLIVIILLVLVGGIAWFFAGGSAQPTTEQLDVEVSLPTPTEGGGSAETE